jgi:hypothetical protein
MEPAAIARLADEIRTTYSPAALDATFDTSTPVLRTGADGSRSITLPREQAPEPLRSMQILDVAPIGDILVVTFRWGLGPEEDDGTIYLMPLDTRDLELDVDDQAAVDVFVLHHVEFSLGPAPQWAHRCTPLGPRLKIVRPWSATTTPEQPTDPAPAVRPPDPPSGGAWFARGPEDYGIG